MRESDIPTSPHAAELRTLRAKDAELRRRYASRMLSHDRHRITANRLLDEAAATKRVRKQNALATRALVYTRLADDALMVARYAMEDSRELYPRIVDLEALGVLDTTSTVLTVCPPSCPPSCSPSCSLGVIPHRHATPAPPWAASGGVGRNNGNGGAAGRPFTDMATDTRA